MSEAYLLHKSMLIFYLVRVIYNIKRKKSLAWNIHKLANKYPWAMSLPTQIDF